MKPCKTKLVISQNVFSFQVFPPPETFIERFICSKAWPAPKAQNGTRGFLLTQLPLRNSSHISGFLLASSFQQGTVESFGVVKTVMSKKVLGERLQRCKMQLPEPCSDRSNELENLHYHSHATWEHLEFWGLAISFIFPITSRDFMAYSILALANWTSSLGPASQPLLSCLTPLQKRAHSKTSIVKMQISEK